MNTRWIRVFLGLEPMVFSFKDEPSPPQAPAPVDPSVQIAAQAKAQPSTYTPFGNIVYSGDPNVAGSYRADVSLSPEQQGLYAGRNAVANALLGRSSAALSSLPTSYKFAGATNPQANQFFTAQKALLDPQFAKDEERLGQRLANQGIPMGSEAYDYEMSQFRKSKDAAYEQAAANALTTGFNQDIATRQQNLNEVAQALGGSQLTPVSGGGSPVDVASAFATNQAQRQQQYQGQLAGYNSGVAQNNATMGGLFQLGAAAIPAISSDRRLKQDVVYLGEAMPGIGIYEYAYRWGGPRHVGVMADEVERVMPEAVIYDGFGFAMVDYGRLFAGRTVN